MCYTDRKLPIIKVDKKERQENRILGEMQAI